MGGRFGGNVEEVVAFQRSSNRRTPGPMSAGGTYQFRRTMMARERPADPPVL